MLGYGMKILSSVIVDGKWYVSGMYMQAQEGQALLEQAERDVRRSPIARIGLVIDADVEGGEAGSTAAAAASELADNAPKGEQRRGQRRHVFRSGSVSASIKSASVTLEAHDEHSGSVLEAGASQHLPQDERGGLQAGPGEGTVPGDLDGGALPLEGSGLQNVPEDQEAGAWHDICSGEFFTVSYTHLTLPTILLV